MTTRKQLLALVLLSATIPAIILGSKSYFDTKAIEASYCERTNSNDFICPDSNSNKTL